MCCGGGGGGGFCTDDDVARGRGTGAKENKPKAGTNDAFSSFFVVKFRHTAAHRPQPLCCSLQAYTCTFKNKTKKLYHTP
jgi:hypothetical protein